MLTVLLLSSLLAVTTGWGSPIGVRSSGHPETRGAPTLSAAAASLRAGGGPFPTVDWSCPSSVSTTLRCSAAPAAPRPSANVTGGWIAGPTTPARGLLVYDAKDGYDLLMAEAPSSNPLDYYGGVASYFSFSNGVWSTLTVVGGPAFCGAGALAFDASDQVVVFWGNALCRTAGDTWTYQNGTWTNVTSGARPPVAVGANIANDPSVLGLLYFGGCCANATGGWTWSYSAGTWSNRSGSLSAEPTADSYGAMSYDTVDRGVVLVEGPTASSSSTSYHTWFFNGSWFAEPTAPVPSTNGRIAPGLADDPIDQYVVLVASWNGTVNRTGPSFHYVNGTWTKGPLHAGLSESLYPALVFDPSTKVAGDLLLEGAPGGANQGPSTTWVYQSGNWTNLSGASNGPGARADIAMTYDAADGYVLAFGGCACQPNVNVSGAKGDTWKFSKGSWTQLPTNVSPSVRLLAGLVYDTADGYVLLFGGLGPSGSLNDTWEFTGAANNWTQITPVVAPPWYQGETMAYDSSDGYVVLLTGFIPASTWTYHAGVWTNLTRLGDRSIDGAPANPIVYDVWQARIVLFGTAHSRPSYSPYLAPDTWRFHAGNWTNLTTSTSLSPPARSGASVADFGPGPNTSVLLYGGSQSFDGLSAPLNDTWEFNGSWAKLSPAVSPGNRSDMVGTFDAADHFDLFYGGWYGQFSPAPLACSVDGPCGDTWYWSGGSSSTPLIQAFTASPSPVDLGATTHLAVSVIGGVPPFQYNYTNLPTGCLSGNNGKLNCTPTASGSWTVSVLATDTGGHSASARVLLTVSAALALSTFTATPSSTHVAERTLLAVQTAHGTPPLSYTYSGLPNGCSTQDIATLPCIPSGSGNFTVGVSVHDGGGGAISGSLNLSVGSAGAAGPLKVTGYWISPATIVLGNSTTISVNATSPDGPLTFAYGSLPPGCTSSNASSLACVPTSAGTYAVTISVRDSAGNFAVVSGNLTVNPVGGGGGTGLIITGFGAAPGTAAVGSVVVLSVVASGGSGPLTYRYPSLPAGCVSANTSALPCDPSAPGLYPLHVVVSDAASHVEGAVGTLLVIDASGPAPAVSSFFATSPTVTVGNSTTLIVEARGALPLTYLYSGLPASCASENRTVLNCTPIESGTFQVTVNVTDRLGRSTSASTWLVVLPGAEVILPIEVVHFRPPTSIWSEIPAYGYVAFAGALVVATLLGVLTMAQRRARAEGDAIVREWNRRSDEVPASEESRKP
ncbi:MAG: kelch repeat-containing protein [Candidatus Lutacidiplasmatales archaeon]